MAHPIEEVFDLIVNRGDNWVHLSGGFVARNNIFMGHARAIDRIDPARPRATLDGKVANQGLYVAAGAPVPPVRFMGQAEEIKSVIVRLSLRWKAYGEGHFLAVEVNNYLLGKPLPNALDFHTLNSEPIVSGPDKSDYHYFVTNYSVDYIQQAA